jgi:hypothetical protein
LAEPSAAEEPEPAEVPKFKLRAKGAAPSPPKALAGEPPPPPPPAPSPPAPAPLPGGDEPMAEPPPLERSVSTMPPMSILAAPLPPPPGSVIEAPAPPGSIPRLSLANPKETPPSLKGTLGRIADKLPKIGAKPVTAKPGKTAAVLRKRAALGPMAKAGLVVVVLAIGVGGYFSYRIFFPEPSPTLRIKPIRPGDAKKAGTDLPKATPTPEAPVPLIEVPSTIQDQTAPTPTPVPLGGPNEKVMGNSSISSDVKVGNMPIDATPAASAAFRAWVANATIGGVYQGTPAKALIDGTIVREGQVIDSALGIAFERIDARRKVIFFKDYTGAEVSKNY